MDTKCTTNKPSIEEVLIRDLIKAKNPGVDFQIKMGMAGIEEVLVDGNPVNVSISGEISPRNPGEAHWSFYAADVDFHQREVEAAKKEHRPPCPIHDQYVLMAAVRMKNPDKKIVSYGFCKNKLEHVYADDLHEYEVNEDGTLKD